MKMAKPRLAKSEGGKAAASAVAETVVEEPTPIAAEVSEPSEEQSAEPVPDDAALKDTTEYLKGLIEGLLFVADHPVDLKELARAARVDKKRTEEILGLLRDEYKTRGIYIEEVADGFAFRSNPRYAGYVRNFLAQRPVRLTRAQLETLAIIAYRQPITRPEADEIRGVDCGPVLKGLLERDLIKILGKKDEPGRPLLYGTTQNFLELFSMQSLSQLPTLREFTELSDESRRTFERQIGEEAPEGPIDLAEAEEPAAASAETASPDAEANASPPEEEEDKEEDEDEEDDDEDDEDDDDDDEEGDDDGEDEDEDDDDEDDDDDDEDDDDE
jgi:segregation and condensation protein B